MTITLNFYIVVNKSYLYHYSEKITVWLIMSYKIKNNIDKIYWNSILHNENKQEIKILKN